MNITEKNSILKRKKQYIKYTKKSQEFINKKLKLIYRRINKLNKKYQGKQLIKHIKNITINLNK